MQGDRKPEQTFGTLRRSEIGDNGRKLRRRVSEIGRLVVALSSR